MGDPYVPIVAMAPQFTLDVLQPTVEELALLLPKPEPHQGWTREMLAWGLLLTTLAEHGVEYVRTELMSTDDRQESA